VNIEEELDSLLSHPVGCTSVADVAGVPERDIQRLCFSGYGRSRPGAARAGKDRNKVMPAFDKELKSPGAGGLFGD